MGLRVSGVGRWACGSGSLADIEDSVLIGFYSFRLGTSAVFLDEELTVEVKDVECLRCDCVVAGLQRDRHARVQGGPRGEE